MVALRSGDDARTDAEIVAASITFLVLLALLFFRPLGDLCQRLSRGVDGDFDARARRRLMNRET